MPYEYEIKKKKMDLSWGLQWEVFMPIKSTNPTESTHQKLKLQKANWIYVEERAKMVRKIPLLPTSYQNAKVAYVPMAIPVISQQLYQLKRMSD